jgi:hypothetical protein
MTFTINEVLNKVNTKVIKMITALLLSNSLFLSSAIAISLKKFYKNAFQ